MELSKIMDLSIRRKSTSLHKPAKLNSKFPIKSRLVHSCTICPLGLHSLTRDVNLAEYNMSIGWYLVENLSTGALGFSIVKAADQDNMEGRATNLQDPV